MCLTQIYGDNIDLGAMAELYACIPGKFNQYLSSVSSVADKVSMLRILNHIQAANFHCQLECNIWSKSPWESCCF